MEEDGAGLALGEYVGNHDGALYIKDLIERYASHVSAGHTRKYDTPMEEGLRLSHDDCPAPNSDAADQMAPKKPIYMALVGAFLWLSNMTRSEILRDEHSSGVISAEASS